VCEDENRIQLAQDRVQWRTFVNTVMSLQLPQAVENSLITWIAIKFSVRYTVDF